MYSMKGSVYFAGTGFEIIFTILLALAVGCTGKGQFSINSGLHWEGSIHPLAVGCTGP